MTEPITIKYIAKMSNIPSATVTINVKYLLAEFPELKKKMVEYRNSQKVIQEINK